MLSDKIEQMKEIGISESETNIQLLLSKFSFNVENAICHYFEHGMSNLPMANPFAANKDRLAKTLHGAKPVVVIATSKYSGSSSEVAIKVSNVPLSSTSVREAEEEGIILKNEPQRIVKPTETNGELFRFQTVPVAKPALKTASRDYNTSKSTFNKIPTADVTDIVHKYTCCDLIGRRMVSGYSISSGYAVRTQSLRFTTENDTSALSNKEGKKGQMNIVNNNKLGKSNTISTSNRNKSFPTSGPKDKFSAGKLFFDTYHDIAAGSIVAQQKNLRGRLSNGLCDFLVPLLRAGLVELRGHVAYDYGPVGTFQDVPVSLHIYVAPRFMDMTVIDLGQTSRDGLENDHKKKSNSSSSSTVDRELQEAANDLLIWLAEGETAVVLLRQQRAKELAAKLSSVVTSGNKSLTESRSNTSLVEEPSLVTDRTARSFDEGAAHIEGEEGAGGELPTMCVDEFLSHEAALNGMPRAEQPLILARDLTMKGYQLQALHWMRRREEVLPSSEHGVQNNNMLQRTSDSSNVESGEGDEEVIFCQPPPTSDLSMPHEGMLRFPVGWGAVEREGNPLWMPIITFRNDYRQGEISPQLVPAVVAAYCVQDRALLPTTSDDCVSVFWWNRYSQRIQRALPLPPRPCRGGILAHEMGMGKTIMMIALIAADSTNEVHVVESGSDGSLGTVVEGGKEGRLDVVVADECAAECVVVEGPSSAEITTKVEVNNVQASEDVVPPFRRSTRRRVVRDEVEDEQEKEEGPVVSTTSDEDEDEKDGALRDTSESENSYSDSEENVRMSASKKRKKGPTGRYATFGRSSVSRRASPEVVDLVDSEEEESLPVSGPSRTSSISVANQSAKQAPLFQSAKRKSSNSSSDNPVLSTLRCGTLIVCPMTLMGQWVEEVRTKTAGALSVCMYYGAERQEDSLARHDVVVTSYGMLVSEAKSRAMQRERADRVGGVMFAAQRNGSKSGSRGLLDVTWRRVVLDEAHTIKNSSTEVARACYSVTAECRWALTGTPIQNSLDDLHSLVRFLHHEPWNQVRWWRKVISEPHATGDPRGITVLRGVLAELMLRRTKTDRDITGRSIIELPGKTCHIVSVALSEAEREFYATLMSRSQAVCRGYETDLRRKNRYAALFTLLLRLRQTCDHAFLAIGKSKDEDEEMQVVVPRTSDPSIAVPIDVNAEVSVEGDEEGRSGAETIEAGVLGPAFLKSIYNKLAHSLRGNQQPSPQHNAPVGNLVVDVMDGGEAQTTRSDSFLKEVMQNLRDMSSSSSSSSSSSAQEIEDEEDVGAALNSRPFECPICYEDTAVLDACITTCGHILCLNCAQTTVRQNGSCPLCMTRLSAEGILPLSGRDQASYHEGGSGEVRGGTGGNGFVFSMRRNYAIQTAFARAVNNNNAARQSLATTTSESGAEVLAALPMNPLVAMMNRREGQAGAWRHWGDKRVVTACEDDGPQYQGLPWHSSSKLATLVRMLDRIFLGMPVELDTSSLSDEVEVLSDSAEIGVNGGSKSCSSSSSSVDKGVKVVVFSQWTSMLDLVEFALQQRDASQRITHRRLDGSMTQAARSSAVNSFNQDDGVRLFLISLKAGGVGLNLTSASVVILLDPWWNPSTEDQAIDRVHRLGQTREVHVYRLICRDTVEERLLLLQDRKRSLSQKAIGGEGARGPEARLSLEDLKSFFV